MNEIVFGFILTNFVGLCYIFHVCKDDFITDKKRDYKDIVREFEL